MTATTFTVVVSKTPDRDGFYHAMTRCGEIAASANGSTPERAMAFAMRDLAQAMLRVFQRPTT